MKKAPTHVPAILGYAASLEQWAKPKQIDDVILAYTNVTQIAMKRGNTDLAEASLRKSLSLLEKIDDKKKLSTLRHISNFCFKYDLAAETYYLMGIELVERDHQFEAFEAFYIANGLTLQGSENNMTHPKSLLELGKIKLLTENNVPEAMQFFDTLLNSEGLESELIVHALVLSGDAKKVCLHHVKK